MTTEELDAIEAQERANGIVWDFRTKTLQGRVDWMLANGIVELNWGSGLHIKLSEQVVLYAASERLKNAHPPVPPPTMATAVAGASTPPEDEDESPQQRIRREAEQRASEDEP